jgi:hypothetical protein
MRIDSSGNVMVGGTVAGNAGTISLNVGNVGSTNGGLQLWGTTTGTHYIQFGDESGTAANHYRGYMAYSHNGDSLRFGTASTERMHIDSSGNVKLSGGNLEFSGGTNATQYIKFGDTGDDDIGNIFYYHGNNNMVFTTNASEAMRIDSSGNLLVGKTSTSINSLGIEARSNGLFSSTRAGNPAGYFTRTTDDGNIAEFRKDGSTVGSIGSANSGTIFDVSASNNSLRLTGGNSSYWLTGAGIYAGNSATRDLGTSTYKWRDLYLSGVGYVGTTQEANTALSGTTPSIDADTAGSFTLTTSGNTTFTFASVTSGRSVGFVLKLTAGGSHTITWPSSVDWAGGTAPDAPASGETDVLVFYTVDGGTNWYGALAIDAAA